MVKYIIVVDHCTRELWTHVKEAFPSLVCICEDTMHLVMKVKSAKRHHATPASRFLSKSMAKFNTPWREGDWHGSLGPFSWTAIWPLGADEQVMANYVKGTNLPPALLQSATGMSDRPGPWRCFREYLLGLAALTTTYPKEMTRPILRNGKPLLRVILGACWYTRQAPYADNIPLRSNLQSDSPYLLFTGMTSSEAFHNELRGAFRQVYNVHEPIMLTKFAVFVLSKRVTWDAGHRMPSLRQLPQCAILARALARPFVDEDLWRETTDTAPSGKKIPKASVSSRRIHLLHMARVRAWLRKRPARRTAPVKKRDVFTQKRKTHLTGGGRNWKSL